jgi:hypothetical protein
VQCIYIFLLQKLLLFGFTNLFIWYNRIDGVEENSSKPDWKLGYRYKGKYIFVFFVEVKRPGKLSVYQANDDRIKPMKQMKDSTDNQIDLGVETPTSFDLLSESNS